MFFETQEVDPTLTEVIVPCIETIGEKNSNQTKSALEFSSS